ncbi:MAG: hypothetical protein J6C64_11695 [Lachnospiraceae bacterium]|nr:hypothetical protein [Lachnospiraceae bacterium]
MNSNQILSSILQNADKKINSNAFVQKYRIENSFSRSGKLSFPNLIYFILQSAHKSISINYSQLRDSLFSMDLSFVSKQAVSKARQRISHKAFLELFHLSVDQFYRNPINYLNGMVFIS